MDKDILAWDNGGKNGTDRYTVVKNQRVFVMSANPGDKNGIAQYVCHLLEIDPKWMDKYQKRVWGSDLPIGVQQVIEAR